MIYFYDNDCSYCIVDANSHNELYVEAKRRGVKDVNKHIIIAGTKDDFDDGYFRTTYKTVDDFLNQTPLHHEEG